MADRTEEQRLFFSLPETFCATALVAILALGVARMDAANPYVWASLGLSLTYGAMLCVFIYFRQYVLAGIAAFIAVVLAIMFLPTIAIPTHINALATLPFLLVAYFLHFKTHRMRRVAWCAAWITAISFCISGQFYYKGTVAKLYELRQAYPVESLESRLVGLRKTNPASAPLTAHVQQRLQSEEDLDAGRQYYGRREAFESLHSRQIKRFLQSNGFGVLRMFPLPIPKQLDFGPLRDFTFHDTSDWFLDLERNNETASPEFIAEKERWVFFAEINEVQDYSRDYHALAVRDFVHPDSFGWVENTSPKRAAGFMPHAFHNLPAKTQQLEPSSHHQQVLSTPIRSTPTTWETKSLQLVSLLRFEKPRAYVLDHLPRMDQLSADSIETRELDNFEHVALRSLYHEQDVVLRRSESQAQMMGAIRAQAVCLDCHDAERGQLLGAFTYRFQSDSSNIAK